MPPLFDDVRPGAKGDDVVSTLRRVAADAMTVRSALRGTPAQLIEQYVAWAETAESLLSNVLEPDSVSDVVHTPSYWALRTATGDIPRPHPFVASELERRQRQLEGVADALDAERVRWSGAATLAIPDTNVLLDEVRVEDIDWPKVIGDGLDVRLVIPLVVVHELDRLKRQGNSTASKGARRALKWLASVLPTPPDSRSSKLRAGTPATTIEVYVHGGEARPPDADATIISVAQRLGWWNTATLVTYDLGMRIRATNAGVMAIRLRELGE